MSAAQISHKILTIPGLDNSGPNHWQSLWEHKYPDCERVAMASWTHPDKDDWVERIDEAVGVADGPLLVAAHSLGCHAFVHWFAAANEVARGRIAGALLVAPPDLTRLRQESRVASFTDAPSLPAENPLIVVASDNDPYAKTAHVWRLSRQWGARFVNAGPFGHINAESAIGDWPYGQYLLASLQPAPVPVRADEQYWIRSGDWPNRVRRDRRFEFRESVYRP